MKEYFQISIIGAGNVGTNLALALENTGHTVNEIYSRDPQNANILAQRLYQAEVQEELDFCESNSNIFILSVKDSVIGEVADKLVLPNSECIVVHTSGTTGSELLESYFDHSGVFYPLQTFTREKFLDFTEIPILIEGSGKKTFKTLDRLASSLSKNVYEMDSHYRKIVHLAAVFASNFTNHMLHVANQILEENKMDLGLLKPLVLEIIEKGIEMGPASAQTGPARRKDLKTLEEHQEMLKDDPELFEIYRIISSHILKSYSS